MVKKSSDEPVDKARERLRQMEEARKPVPDEKVFKSSPGKAKKAGKTKQAKPKKSKLKSTKKNK